MLLLHENRVSFRLVHSCGQVGRAFGMTVIERAMAVYPSTLISWRQYASRSVKESSARDEGCDRDDAMLFLELAMVSMVWKEDEEKFESCPDDQRRSQW